MFWTTAITILVSFFVYITIKAWNVNQHWKRKGIPHSKPDLFFGNLFDVVAKRRTLGEVVKSLYDAFPDEPVIGYYHFVSPQYLIRSPALLERVLITDFAHFSDHNAPMDMSHNLLSVNLFSMTGSTWHSVRSRISPIFTASKLRNMIPRMVKLSDRLLNTIDENLDENVNVHTKALNYSLDLTGSCAFGLDVDTLHGENRDFSEAALSPLKPSLRALCRSLFALSFPNLSRYLKITFFTQKSERYFTTLLRSVLKTRAESKSSGNDLIEMLLELKKRSYLDVGKHDSSVDNLGLDEPEEKLELTDDLLIGQAFSFLLAGLETTALTILMACVQLAANPECQRRARDEIRRAVENEGSLTLEVLNNLDYLERCFKETLRLHAPLDTLTRYCAKNYTVPGTSVVIERGDKIVISASGVNLDPRIHDEPLKYNPDRWLSEMKTPAASFLSFGEGPRTCIGIKFAMLGMKCLLCKILLKYDVRLHPSVELPMKMNPHAFLPGPLQDVPFIFEKIAS